MKVPTCAQASRVVAACAFIACAALAGCTSGGNSPAGSGGSPTAAGGAGGAGGALGSCASYPGAKSCHFVTVTASGAQNFHGTDTVPNQQACSSVLAQDASSNGGEVQLSAPTFVTGPVGAFTVFLDSYHGPGTYTLASNDASVMVLIGNTQYSATGAGSAISAVAAADGSVSVSFTKLASSAGSSQTISGHAQFTCQNA